LSPVKSAIKPGSCNPHADYYEWLNQQAGVLREMQPLHLDWRELAEELEKMGARERRELISPLRILMAHALK
jgi:hypothetical protein